jgi:hypothetical protein
LLTMLEMVSEGDPGIVARGYISGPGRELLHKTSSGLVRTVVPGSLRGAVMRAFHDHPTAGHLGIDKTFKKISGKLLWRNMKNDIRDNIRGCEVCQCIKPPIMEPMVSRVVRWQKGVVNRYHVTSLVHSRAPSGGVSMLWSW